VWGIYVGVFGDFRTGGDKRHRSTVYDDIEKIRAIFEDEGLRDFLP